MLLRKNHCRGSREIPDCPAISRLDIIRGCCGDLWNGTFISMSTHRGVVHCGRGGAAAAQPLAVSAALSILQKGGSFIDAGIACSAVLAVVEPDSSHIGGDAFLVTHLSSTKGNLAFNGSGEAPSGSNSHEFADGIPFHGFKSATVPGLVSTWFAAHDRFGKMSLQDILMPAINYAENGFPANAHFVRGMRLHMAQYPDSTIFTDMGISATINVGDIVVQKNLAQTLKAIVEEGRAAFYQGSIALKLISASDGWISADDLSSHYTRISEPLCVAYRELNVYGQPPPSQGMILMQELLLADKVDLKSMSSANRIHFMVEAKKKAFQDRFKVLGDYEGVNSAVSDILNESHTAKIVSEIDMKKADNTSCKTVEEGSDTTYFLIVDDEGNAVSWIQSIFHPYGSAWVAEGTGILLNNRMTGFSLDPKSPNFVTKGKRPAHTLNAWIATDQSGALKYVGGTPGANVQVQSNFQILVDLVDLGLDVQEACEAPRWQHVTEGGHSGYDEGTCGVLGMETRFPKPVIDELKAKGHIIGDLGPWGHFSSVQLLEVLPNGTYAIGSDPRTGGHAAGY